MRPNLTTPGGFFVGLGGIVAFCLMTAVIFFLVKMAGWNKELRPQQEALGLAPKADMTATKDIEEIHAKTRTLLASAAAAYNDGRKPNLDNLAELRGVVRYRAAQETDTKAIAALNAPSNVSGKTVIEAAMEATVADIKAKPAAKSAVPLMEIEPADPKAEPVLPNFTGGGTKTQHFPDPNAKPAPAPAPAPAAPATPPAPGTPPAAAPGTPQPPAAAPAPQPAPAPQRPPAPASPAPAPVPAPTAPQPARPPLINPSEPQK